MNGTRTRSVHAFIAVCDSTRTTAHGRQRTGFKNIIMSNEGGTVEERLKSKIRKESTSPDLYCKMIAISVIFMNFVYFACFASSFDAAL